MKILFIFKEPSSISIEVGVDKKVSIKFYGYNQEKPDGDYLFAGYDLYYYFESPEQAKRAMVYTRFPYETKTSPDDSTRNKNLLPSDEIKGTRALYNGFASSNFMYVYQNITFPITEHMITNVLYEANTNNVVLYFHDFPNNDGEFSNPMTDNGKQIYIDMIYPDYDEYPQNVDEYEEGKNF